MINNNEQHINISNSENFNIGNNISNFDKELPSKCESQRYSINKSKLRKMLGENNLQAVIDKLLMNIKERTLNNQVLLLNSQLNQVEMGRRINIISFSENQVEKNRIRNGLLEIIDLIQ